MSDDSFIIDITDEVEPDLKICPICSEPFYSDHGMNAHFEMAHKTRADVSSTKSGQQPVILDYDVVRVKENPPMQLQGLGLVGSRKPLTECANSCSDMASIDGKQNGFFNRVHCKGQIQLIFGPMFSGKTTELLRRINRFKIAKYKVLLIKYAKDCRYDDESVITHDRHAVLAKKAITLKESTDECLLYDVIGIDEGQFFPDILEFAEVLANHGKIIIVSALDGTYQREEFGNIVKLVPKAESIVKLSAVCIVCSEDAAYTRRFSSETTVELIGGAEKYMAVCRDCYHKELPVEFHTLSDNDVKNMCSPHKPIRTVEEENHSPRPVVQPMRVL